MTDAHERNDAEQPAQATDEPGVDIYHRMRGGGTYIARYRIQNSDRYIEGYGRNMSQALEQLAMMIKRHPMANGEVFFGDE